MGKLGILLAVLATLARPAPVSARTLSAQDVLTVCMTTPKDPKDVLVYFYANGWADVADADKASLKETVALIFSATNPRVYPRDPIQKQLEAQLKFWPRAQTVAASVLGPTPKTPVAILKHITGAILLFKFEADAMILTQCFLGVPEAATKPQEFSPKLAAPSPPALFEGKLESAHLTTTRTRMLAQTVSVDPVAVERNFGIKTDITAVYYGSIQYPAWAVNPSPTK